MPDLPSRRAARTSGSRPIIGHLSPAIKALLTAEVAVYVVFLLVRPLRPAMALHLAISPRLFAGEYWQLVTAIFLHLDPQALLYSLLGIWWAASDVERAQGTRRMVALFLISGILTNLVVAVVSRHMLGEVMIFGGASFAVIALFVAYGRIYNRTPANLFGVFSLQARYIAIGFVGWEVVGALAGPAIDWTSLAGIATATVVGYFGAGPGGLQGLWDTLKVRRLRRRYRVIEGGAGRPPKNYMN